MPHPVIASGAMTPEQALAATAVHAWALNIARAETIWHLGQCALVSQGE